jgi:hypothetical protein
VGFLEPVRDLYFPGAFLQALAAFGTPVSAVVLRNKKMKCDPFGSQQG